MQHVGHALLPHPAGENDAVVGEVSGESPKPGGEAAGATTNNNKGGVGKVGEHIRPESHELILAFTGHQTGNTHHIVPTNPPTQLGAHSLTLGSRKRAKSVTVHPGRQPFEGGLTKSGPEPAEGVVGNVGDHIAVAANNAQYLAGAGQHGPTHLMPVGGCDNAAGAGGAGGPGHEGEGGGGTEPHHINVFGTNDLLHAAGGGRGGQHDATRPPVHPVCRLAVPVGGRGGVLGGGKHHNILRWEGIDEIAEIRLDTADGGRKIVGDQ